MEQIIEGEEGHIDNEAARLGLVKSYSPVLPSLKMIMASAVWDYEHDCKSWYRSSSPIFSLSKSDHSQANSQGWDSGSRVRRIYSMTIETTIVDG